MSWKRLFWVEILVGIYKLINLDIWISLFRFGEFSCITTLKKLMSSFSLFSFWVSIMYKVFLSVVCHCSYGLFSLFHSFTFVLLHRRISHDIFCITDSLFFMIQSDGYAFYCIFFFSFQSLCPSALEFLIGYFSFLNFTFYLCIISMISSNCLSVFSYSSLSFLKILFWNIYFKKSQISISLESVIRKLLCSFGHIMFLGFSYFLKFVLLSSHLKKQSPPPPIFTDLVYESNTFFQPCQRSYGFLRHFVWILMLHTSYFPWDWEEGDS